MPLSFPSGHTSILKNVPAWRFALLGHAWIRQYAICGSPAASPTPISHMSDCCKLNTQGPLMHKATVFSLLTRLATADLSLSKSTLE
jgi:hypothetical protein